MTIDDRGVELKSRALQGRRVALGVCGGIGAIEVVKISRELRRHGAELSVYVTPSVSQFITPLSLGWGANGPVIEGASAAADHLEPLDLVLVVPATWNTLAKMGAGLADNPVTLLVASQLGAGRPVGVVPTMNSQLAGHPRFSQTLEVLKGWGVKIFEGEEEEGRFKVPSPERVFEFTKSCLEK